jgi:hypothetical protein
MIECYEGRIGGGKTLSAVERMLLVWKDGGICATNIAVRWDNCKALLLRRFGVVAVDDQFKALDNDDVRRFWECVPLGTRERPVLVVIDEADVWLANASYAQKDKQVEPKFWNFLKQSRKLGADVIFITQALKNLSGQIGRLTQFVWRFRDMEKVSVSIPILGEFRWPFGKQIIQVQCDQDGKTVLKRRYWTKDPELFECYDTCALYDKFETLEARPAEVKLERVVPAKFDVPEWAVWVAVTGVVAVLLTL